MLIGHAVCGISRQQYLGRQPVVAEPGSTLEILACLRHVCNLHGDIGQSISFDICAGRSVLTSNGMLDPAAYSDSVRLPESQLRLFPQFSQGRVAACCFSLCSFGRYALMRARARPETQGPRHQCSRRTADRHNGDVPHKHVSGLKIWAMQFQHSHTGQAAKRSCC